MRFRVTPNQIAPLIRLKVPWRNEHHISFTYPNAPFHLAPYTTHAFVSILASNKHTVEAEQPNSYSQNIICGWKHQPTQFSLAQDFLLAQPSTPILSLKGRVLLKMIAYSNSNPGFKSLLFERVGRPLCLRLPPDARSPLLWPF